MTSWGVEKRESMLEADSPGENCSSPWNSTSLFVMLTCGLGVG